MPPMAGIGKGMAPVSSQTTAEKKAYLLARAERIDETSSAMFSQLIDFWLAMDAPPLCEADSLEQKMPLPLEVQVKLRSYWMHLVAFEAMDGRSKTDKKEAAAVMRHARGHASRGARKPTPGAPKHPPSGRE
jgi:hypothetical protein